MPQVAGERIMKNPSSGALTVVGSSRHVTGDPTRASTTGMAILDREYRLAWINACASGHLGIAPQAAGTRPCLPGDSPLGAYLAAGDFKSPLRLETSQGLVISIEILPFSDSDWLLLSRDITRSEQLDVMRRDFVADTSHELRAPLCVLSGLVETMSELEPDPEQSEKYLQLMDAQCKRMRSIVDGLLELSSIEGKPAPSHAEKVNVASLLARLRAEAEVLSAGRHTIVLQADSGFDLLGSERDITSALGNLVSNAVRYTQPGGEVRILWHASAKGGEIVVQDTGVGIEAKHLPLLTERFYRVQPGSGMRCKQGGAGLGLAIVKTALSRHQATLEIASEAGKGSRFVARFPAHRLAARGVSVATLAA